MRINKKEFVRAIKEVQSTLEYHDKLNSFLHKNDVDGYLFQPDCTSTVLHLLHILFENESEDLINYFCYELDFGKEWHSGDVLDENGKEIKLKTIGDLYDYLNRGEAGK